MRTVRLTAFVLAIAVQSTLVTGASGHNLSRAEIGHVLHCLKSKLRPIGYAPPRFTIHAYRVRYILGIVDKATDREDELHLVVYAPGEKKAVLYEVYLEERRGIPSVYIGEMGTLKVKNTVMKPDEIWGGVGTYRRVSHLLKELSNTQPLDIPEQEVVAGPRACVFDAK